MSEPVQEQLSINIRKARPDDLKEVKLLFIKSITTLAKNDYTPEQINAWQRGAADDQRWHDAVMSQFFLIAENDEGKLLGFGSLKSAYYIDFLYVLPDFAGKGIAKKIYRNLEKEALNRGASALLSDVSKTAKSFFLREGYEIQRENLFIRGNTEIVNFRMLKYL